MIDFAPSLSSMAIEVSALSVPELPGLLAYLGSAPRLPFLFVSVHAPSKGLNGNEREHVQALSRIPAWVNAIVVHPDTMADPDSYRQFGRRLVIENMDTHKRCGEVADELGLLFARLPHARLCLDVAYAKDVDHTMQRAAEILDRFANWLSHVHLSSLDEAKHHFSLTPEDEDLSKPVLSRCRDVPWILEAPPNS